MTKLTAVLQSTCMSCRNYFTLSSHLWNLFSHVSYTTEIWIQDPVQRSHMNYLLKMIISHAVVRNVHVLTCVKIFISKHLEGLGYCTQTTKLRHRQPRKYVLKDDVLPWQISQLLGFFKHHFSEGEQ